MSKSKSPTHSSNSSIQIQVDKPNGKRAKRKTKKRKQFPWIPLLSIGLVGAIAAASMALFLSPKNELAQSGEATTQSIPANNAAAEERTPSTPRSSALKTPSIDEYDAELQLEENDASRAKPDDLDSELGMSMPTMEQDLAGSLLGEPVSVDESTASSLDTTSMMDRANSASESNTGDPITPPTSKNLSIASPLHSPSQKSASAKTEANRQTILSLYRDRKLFQPNQYQPLRSIQAAEFEQSNLGAIEAALGLPDSEARSWLEEHAEIKEELFTAIDPQRDDVAAALKLFDNIREKYPEKILTHAQLAIATALVWDDAKGVYRYRHHQRRVHAVDPEGAEAEKMDALANFDYFLLAENVMQGRGQFLPWEFLLYTVNHPTPLADRKWAVGTYLRSRAGFGKCYADVPYDHVMLETGSESCRLDGKPYTLANLKQFGGVCAQQADFAARVGKSLGVPSAYVNGQSRFGGAGHAWVMWVEIKSVNAKGIQFVLDSHGRYRGDLYYVGNLKDAQTGEAFTDRELEQRLSSVGASPQNHRRAAWLMNWYPIIRDSEKLDVLNQLRFLGQVVAISPLSRPAWEALAEMSRRGVVEQRHEKLMMTNLRGMFMNFAKYPDFTWEIFADLIEFQKLPQKRVQLFSQLIALYEQAGRPDLASEARLLAADELVKQENVAAAIGNLAEGILRFPQDGRYVPNMLDRMEQLATDSGVHGSEVLGFYRRFLPLIQRKRGNTPSQYCIKMYERGISRFMLAGDKATANLLQAEVNKLSQ